jgi:hypothetical protein
MIVLVIVVAVLFVAVFPIPSAILAVCALLFAAGVLISGAPFPRRRAP